MTTEETNELPPESRSDDELVQLYFNCRRSEEPAVRRTALRAWHILMARHHDRVVAWVSTFQFPEQADVTVPAADRDDVVQQAHERCLARLSENFRGTTAAEFRAALKTCVQFACMDHCRAIMRREMGLAGSLDETLAGDGGAELGRFDQALAELSARIEEGRFGAALDVEAIGGALGRVRNEDMQAVIRMTVEGYNSREIADQIGKNVANVDQLRSRGMRELKEQLQDDE